MKFYSILCFLMLLISCDVPNEPSSLSEESTDAEEPKKNSEKRELDAAFKQYWYSGLAEISSYDLTQSRYGELRDGTAVLIFVTEPFDATEQLKADQQAPSNRSVLKLNATRDFYTGIYPYKIMSSTFFPLDVKENAIKVATSIQEWCGHTYMQLNQTNAGYDGVLYSYFQSEGNKSFELENAILENQIPSQLRLGPEMMPVGEIKVLPSTEYLRLAHEESIPLPAAAKLEETNTAYTYTITYENGRKVTYTTDLSFPYQIQSFEEVYEYRGKTAVTTATLKKTLRTTYWNQNGSSYEVLRDSLGI